MMDAVLLALLFAAALWLGDRYNANKFRYFYPKLSRDLLSPKVPGWKKVWVYHNQAFKNLGLFSLWVGVLGANAAGVGEGAFYGLACVGFVLYLASRLWPMLVKRGPLGRIR